jgi:hypothetical protein
MALFTAAQFSNGYDHPVGMSGAPAHPGDAVTLALSDGQVITVFDTLTTALKLANLMRTHKQWTVAASEDVTIALASGGIKMLVCENTLQNQKLLTSLVPCYIGDELQFVHRSMSHVVSLTEAQRSVGFCVKSATPFHGNLSLRLACTNLQILDWNYQARPADDTQGSQLHDGAPLLYDFTVKASTAT